MKPVIVWQSGGVTSAVAGKLAIDLFGLENCRFVFQDTRNEDKDTYRFLSDLEKWFGKEIERITNPNYNSIADVWRAFKGLNFANGAICSTELKRAVREKFEKENEFSYQVFGYDPSEPNRAIAFAENYPDSNPRFPLLYLGITKSRCIKILKEAGISEPVAYKLGFNNNNCLETGCVRGGIGYWQMMGRVKPENFEKMAAMEHELTELKGQPVTMLKDQGKNGKLVFLKPHPKYPEHKDISQMKGRPPKPLTDCIGWCGVLDLEKRNKTEKEINSAA